MAQLPASWPPGGALQWAAGASGPPVARFVPVGGQPPVQLKPASLPNLVQHPAFAQPPAPAQQPQQLQQPFPESTLPAAVPLGTDLHHFMPSIGSSTLAGMDAQFFLAHQAAVAAPMPEALAVAAAQQTAQAAECAAPPGGEGRGKGRRDPSRPTRQQLRQQQHALRRAEHQRIKALEQQLGTMRSRLQSLSLENKCLKQRQAALSATLDLQQQMRAAEVAAAASSNASLPSEDVISLDGFGFDSEEEEGEAEAGAARQPGRLPLTAADLRPGGLLAALLEGDEAALGAQPEGAAGASLASPVLPGLVPAAQDGGGSPAGDKAEDEATGWLLSASLREHVLWYKQQVDRLAELLRVLDGIPPRLQRSLEDYRLHEETMDGIQAVLTAVDDWTIRMAALRPHDYGLVLHNNLEEFLEDCPPGGRCPGQAQLQQLAGSPPSSGGGGAGEASHEQQQQWRQPDEAAIWQELVAQLQLTPKQEQTLEAHQALFEQREAALEVYKAQVLSAIADAAAKQDDQAAALELLQGAEALKESLQKDLLVKAPVMISLRKVLSPLQMARLTVKCWPFHVTMKNLSRAHKQRKAQQAYGRLA